MNKNAELTPLSSNELISISGGNQMASDMGYRIGHAIGSGIRMFLFCAAVYALI